MKVLELFAGTGIISRTFREHGHETYTVDWNPKLPLSLCTDISTLTAEKVIELCGGRPDVIWASPDCSSYSVAALGTHRKKNPVTKELEPQTDYAKFCDATNRHVIDLIMELDPKYYFIENPRGAMRKMSWMQDLPRYTVTYCKYGEERMKPTDIWTNHPNPKFLPPCKNGDPCHVSAPRGTKQGTQGLKGSLTRAAIPLKLCEHIVEICEEDDKMTENYIKWPCDPITGQKKGYYEAREGDAVTPEHPYAQFKSVQKDIAFAHTATGSNSGVCVNDNDKLRIRYLTPRECFRLMGQTEEDIDKVQELGLSKSTQYKLAGNSIVVDVLEAIFKGIYIDDTFEKPKGKQMSLEGWA